MKAPLRTRLRRLWAVTRWMALAAAFPLLWACTARTLEPPQYHPVVVTNNVYKSSLNNQLDILFMIDNSMSMSLLQKKLVTNFPVFMNRLKALPKGLPDIHVAVISSDTGPGNNDLPRDNCRKYGDQGMFQYAPRGDCTTSPLNAGQTFLQASGDQAQKNYSGDITDAFTCIAALGEGGCGFEGQLKSVRWALDPDNVPDGNQGFLRDDAYLAVILITNEDDCSVPDDSDLIDETQIHMSDPYGPFDSFRCNEFGHLCNIDGVMQHPVRGMNTDLMGCISDDTATGRETKVADEIAFLKGLKPPNQILVAAFTGPVMDYNVDMVSTKLPDATVELQPVTRHSCMQDSGEFADPAIRIHQWVAAFGDHGYFLPICAPSFEPALTQIADALSQLIGPQCVTGTVRNHDLNGVSVPDCAVNDRYKDPTTMMTVETAIAACDPNNHVPPCWTLDDDAMCPGAKILSVDRGTNQDKLANNVNTDVACSLCPDGVTQSGCP